MLKNRKVTLQLKNKQYVGTYNSPEHVSGFSILYPLFKNLFSSLLLMPGYGKPPEKQSQPIVQTMINCDSIQLTLNAILRKCPVFSELVCVIFMP